MPGRIFLDTNVLVSAIESAGPDAVKSVAALALLKRADVCLSAQVLGECIVKESSAGACLKAAPKAAPATLSHFHRRPHLVPP